MSKFEISETPQVENTSLIEQEGLKVGKVNEVVGTTSILKILINGEPYYNFSSVVFNEELATKNNFVKIGSKTFYKGLKNSRMKNRLKLVSIN